jgi:hypothetical protein
MTESKEGLTVAGPPFAVLAKVGTHAAGVGF